MGTPLVSIVIPAHNAEAHILDAIRSALGQSFEDLEVIVVDDGSTDDTFRLVREHDDPRIQIVRQENEGQSSAINTGVSIRKTNALFHETHLY